MSAVVYIGSCDLGLGVFAARRIAAGERILAFAGRVCTADEVAEMGDAEANALQVAERVYLCLERPSVLANHSCEPNSGVAEGLTLVALRDIKRGEEVRYDYSTTMEEGRWTMACLCHAPTCRGLVRDFSEIPTERQRLYLRLGVVMPFIARLPNLAQLTS